MRQFSSGKIAPVAPRSAMAPNLQSNVFTSSASVRYRETVPALVGTTSGKIAPVAPRQIRWRYLWRYPVYASRWLDRCRKWQNGSQKAWRYLFRSWIRQYVEVTGSSTRKNVASATRVAPKKVLSMHNGVIFKGVSRAFFMFHRLKSRGKGGD